MFLKKLLPLLVLIPLLVGNQFQTGSANSSPTLSPKNYLRPLSTITVCASLACDYQLIQDAINNAAANDTIDLSTQIYVESITIDKDLTIIGDGWENSIIQAAASQGAADARVITVPNGVSVTLDGITIRYGEAIGNGTDAYGGGIFNQGNITIRDCMVTQNISGFGGGIANGIGAGQATAEFINSSIRLNEAIAEGAGIFNEASANGNSSTITITHSTVSENSAQNGGGVANIAGNGAARFSSFNSTISENSVDSNGGGLLNEVTNNGSALATINQSTFDDNNNGNIYNNNGIVNLSQSIVANSPNGNLDCENIGVDGRVFDDEFNLVEDGTCGFPTGGDPLLGILTLNGGDTQTRALLPGSPALDAIPPAQCASYLDQRDFIRPFGAGCDIGAFELDTIELEFDQSINQQSVIPGQLITFTVKVHPIGPGISGGVVTATIPEELSIQWPIQLDPPESGTIGEPPILAHSIIITANHGLTMTLPTVVALGIPGGTDLNNIVSFYSTEIITPAITNVLIHVNNASPIAIDDGGASYLTDPIAIFTTGNILDNDSDPNGDTLIIRGINTSLLKGILTPLGVELSKPYGDGTFSYNPDGQFNDFPPGETGTDRFTYEITDGQGGVDEAIVTITILQNSNFIYLPLTIKGQ